LLLAKHSKILKGVFFLKKGKVITLSRVLVCSMVLLLGAAIWLNTKYSSGKTKYMGETTFVSTTESEAVPTAAEVSDYFTEAKTKRDSAYKEAKETAEELLESPDSAEKKKAAEELNTLIGRLVKQNDAENMLTAKGFQKNLVIISDEMVTAVVESGGLTAAQTVQIQDIIMSCCSAELNNIKIVTVNS
jgi:hypothetical protein